MREGFLISVNADFWLEPARLPACIAHQSGTHKHPSCRIELTLLLSGMTGKLGGLLGMLVGASKTANGVTHCIAPQVFSRAFYGASFLIGVDYGRDCIAGIKTKS